MLYKFIAAALLTAVLSGCVNANSDDRAMPHMTPWWEVSK